MPAFLYRIIRAKTTFINCMHGKKICSEEEEDVSVSLHKLAPNELLIRWFALKICHVYQPGELKNKINRSGHTRGRDSKCAINLYGVFVPFRVRFTRVLWPRLHSNASRAVKFETVVFLAACKQLYVNVTKELKKAAYTWTTLPFL